MATATKKKTKAKAPKKLAGAARQLVEALASDVTDATDTVTRALEGLTKNMNLSQDSLEAIILLQKMQKKMADVVKAFNKKAIAHKEDKGSFEHGRIAINFNVSAKRTPKWKDEAVKLAAENGEVEKDFTDRILEATEKTYSTSVKLTISE